MHERFGLVGRLQVFASRNDIVSLVDRERALLDGTCELIHAQSNLVVNQGLTTMSRLLGGPGCGLIGGASFAASSDITVTRMELGSAAVPPPPQATDTNSVGAFVYAPVVTASCPDNYSVSFSGSVPILELIGTTITEEVLKLTNGLVFAKVKLTVPILKTNAAALLFVHTVSISRI